MIVQNGHSLQSKCEMRKWKHVLWDFSIPPLGYNFLWVTWPASTRVFAPQEERAWERGCIQCWVHSAWEENIQSNFLLNLVFCNVVFKLFGMIAWLPTSQGTSGDQWLLLYTVLCELPQLGCFFTVFRRLVSCFYLAETAASLLYTVRFPTPKPPLISPAVNPWSTENANCFLEISIFGLPRPCV
jgi:hypothetical protein